MDFDKKCKNNNPLELQELETWPGHFLSKETESKIVLEKLPFLRGSKGLEIGCGNGFQSLLLSCISRYLVATDLYKVNPSSHTVGMQKANTLLRKLNIDNVKLISCDVQDLPFADEHFDFVFSASTIEHIKDKLKAIREIKRVLKPQGFFIMIVPTHMPSFYAPFNLLAYIASRIIYIVRKKEGAHTNNNNNIHENYTWHNLLKRFMKNHPSFPLPEPHGDYPTVFHEFFQQIPYAWSSILKRSGFKIRESFGTCILPWSLIEPFSTAILAKWYEQLKDFHSAYGHLGIIRYFCYLICFVAQKD